MIKIVAIVNLNMKTSLADISKSFSNFCLSLAIVVTPLFFLPLTTDFFSFNKQVFFILLTSLSLISWLVYTITTKTVRLTLSPMLLPFTLLAAAAIVSTITNSSGSVEVWLGRTSLYIALTVFYLLTTTLFQSARQVRRLINGLIIAASLAAGLGILSITGLWETTNLPAYLIVKSFTPLGSPLALVSFLVAILPPTLMLAFKTRSGPNKLFYFLGSGLIISAVILVGFQLLPGQTYAATLLPKLASWSIAIDTFKSSLLFGSGPASFIQQFTKFKPLSLNRTPLWANVFTVSGNEVFQIITTLGIAGMIAFAMIIISWVKLSKRNPGTRITATQLAIYASIVTILITSLLIPFTVTTWIVLTSLLALTISLNKMKNLTKIKDVVVTINAITIIEPTQPTVLPSQQTNLDNLLPWMLALPTIVGLIFTASFFSRAYAADYYLKQSLDAANQNRGSDTYNLQIKAIQKMPNLDRYHLVYSNTNLALANSLASQGDLTDQDQQTIAQLVQQAIREARTATQLNPQKSNNWHNLANIYRNLVNFADGADQFAIAAYIRAIQLDPTNPGLRIELGGLFYSLQRYEEAIDRFKEAVQLKPDLPNAHYNLSAAYQKTGKILEAYQSMQQVVALVPADSQDAQKAQQELDDLKNKLPQAPSQPTQENVSDETQQLNPPSPPPPAPEDFQPIELKTEEATPSSKR